MNRCIQCGEELTTGDIRWDINLCNECNRKDYALTTGRPLEFVDLKTRTVFITVGEKTFKICSVEDWNNVMNYVNKERAEKDQRIAELKKANESFTLIIKKIQEVTGRKDVCVKDVREIGNNLAIEKLEELLKWVDKESDGDQKYPAPILIDKINSMIKSLKGEKQ